MGRPPGGLKKPGFSVTMLPVRNNLPQTSHAFYQTMISGKKESFQNIPVRGYSIKNKYIYYIEYGALPGDLSMVKILPLSETEKPVQKTFWVGTDRFGRDCR